MFRVGDDLLLEALERQEDYIHEAADAIDVKAGLILAAAAVLAIQPAVLLIVPHVVAAVFVVQLLSFIVLCTGVWLAHNVLRIEGYESPGFQESWRDEIISSAGEEATDETIRGTMLWGLVMQAERRVAKGRLLNNDKLNVLKCSRWCVSVSFAVNILILVAILTVRFFV